MTRVVKVWLMGIIEGLTENPMDANFKVESGRFDLEVVIVVAPTDRIVFTEEVCLALTTLLKVATGVLHPVVYLDRDPHPAAKEALDYAANQL
jgi:hypothetical protein